MGKVKVITAKQAAELVQDGTTVVLSGFVGSALAEGLNRAVEQRFLETGHPQNLTVYHTSSLGNRDGSGADHFAHDGMVKRVIAGHWNMAPNLVRMAIENKIEAYNLPQGAISQLFRDIAAHRPGLITHVGLGTFVDPRVDGGKLNSRTTEDIVEVIELAGRELLFYKATSFDLALMRGTFADENGNITMEHEAVSAEVTAIAQAVKNSGGKVVVQVKKVVPNGTLDPKLVKIPGIYVDYVVIAQDESEHPQCMNSPHDDTICGLARAELGDVAPIPLNAKKMIARRAAMELEKDIVVNLGIGIPEFISMVANEEGIGDYMTLTVEAGPIGGIPQGGPRFGASVNPEAILDQPTQFDFYDGGGLDLAYLGLAQVDGIGNINVSRFGTRIAGAGGFINITQNAKKVCFCGTFTAGGLKVEAQDGKLAILEEGQQKKFVQKVDQITFSGEYARKIGQPVLYITERAVFELRADGLYLTEVAPGIDLQKQVLDMMDFEVKMNGEPKQMDARIFRDEPMGLAE